MGNQVQFLDSPSDTMDKTWGIPQGIPDDEEGVARFIMEFVHAAHIPEHQRTEIETWINDTEARKALHEGFRLEREEDGQQVLEEHWRLHTGVVGKLRAHFRGLPR